MKKWSLELKKIKQLTQCQDSLYYQLKVLYHIANKFGLYDAADYCRNITEDIEKNGQRVNCKRKQ